MNGEIVRARVLPSNLTWLWIGGYGDKYGNRIRLADPETGEPTAFAYRIADSGVDVLSAPVFRPVYYSYSEPPNLTPQVIDLFHSRGMVVEYALAGTGTGRRWNGENGGWEATKREIDEAFKVCPNLDAIHDGEVAAITYEDSFDKAFAFFKNYYNYVKNTYGKRVIFNTGTANTPEIVMTICDALSVEFRGEKFIQNQAWAKDPKYEGRFYCRPISYSWRGTIQEAIGDMEYHWDLGYRCVGATYNAFWPRSGKSVHPFPRIYDWWDQLFKQFE